MAQIQILGSAAAEGIPAIFCKCRVCREAWENGGKDVRFRTAYKLNDRVRIDFGPDSLAQEYKFKLHSENLKHLFITHSHEDHLYLDLLDYRMPGFSVVEEDNILNVYGDPGVIRAINRHLWDKSHQCFSGDFKRFRLRPVTLEAFRPVVLEDEDMEFYPLKADHMIGSATDIPNIFLFRVGKSWGMVANDTGFFREETWDFLEKKKFRLDLVISDCTGGIRDYERGHMSGKYALGVKQRLKQLGSVTGNTRYYVNHFSHNGNATHTELESYFRPHGIEVGFDGLVIDF